MYAHFQWFMTPLPPFPLSSPVHIWLTSSPCLSVRAQTLNMIPNFSAIIRLHLTIFTISSSYTNTKIVSQKVKYLLTTLTRDENRKQINIQRYLMEIGKNTICFKEPIYCSVWTHQRAFLTLINMGYQVLANSIKIWDNI